MLLLFFFFSSRPVKIVFPHDNHLAYSCVRKPHPSNSATEKYTVKERTPTKKLRKKTVTERSSASSFQKKKKTENKENKEKNDNNTACRILSSVCLLHMFIELVSFFFLFSFSLNALKKRHFKLFFLLGKVIKSSRDRITASFPFFFSVLVAILNRKLPFPPAAATASRERRALLGTRGGVSRKTKQRA